MPSCQLTPASNQTGQPPGGTQGGGRKGGGGGRGRHGRGPDGRHRRPSHPVHLAAPHPPNATADAVHHRRRGRACHPGARREAGTRAGGEGRPHGRTDGEAGDSGDPGGRGGEGTGGKGSGPGRSQQPAAQAGRSGTAEHPRSDPNAPSWAPSPAPRGTRPGPGAPTDRHAQTDRWAGTRHTRAHRVRERRHAPDPPPRTRRAPPHRPPVSRHARTGRLRGCSSGATTVAAGGRPRARTARPTGHPVRPPPHRRHQQEAPAARVPRVEGPGPAGPTAPARRAASMAPGARRAGWPTAMGGAGQTWGHHPTHEDGSDSRGLARPNAPRPPPPKGGRGGQPGAGGRRAPEPVPGRAPPHARADRGAVCPQGGRVHGAIHRAELEGGSTARRSPPPIRGDWADPRARLRRRQPHGA